MPQELVAVANLLEYKLKMAKLIIHTTADLDAIDERRLQENFALTPEERIQKAFQLMKLSLLFKKETLKKPQGKGVVLKFK
jgi:hypothetical protein